MTGVRENYLKILGLQPEDNPDEATVRAAYRRLAMKYHSDKNINSSEKSQGILKSKFNEITTAYKALSALAHNQAVNKYHHVALQENEAQTNEAKQSLHEHIIGLEKAKKKFNELEDIQKLFLTEKSILEEQHESIIRRLRAEENYVASQLITIFKMRYREFWVKENGWLKVFMRSFIDKHKALENTPITYLTNITNYSKQFPNSTVARAWKYTAPSKDHMNKKVISLAEEKNTSISELHKNTKTLEEVTDTLQQLRIQIKELPFQIKQIQHNISRLEKNRNNIEKAAALAAFKLIYQAMIKNQVSFFNSDPISQRLNQTDNTDESINVITAWCQRDKRIKRAWELANIPENYLNCTQENRQLMTQIYLWKFNHSGIFKQSKVTGMTFYSGTALSKTLAKTSLTDQQILFGRKKPNTRMGSICNIIPERLYIK